MMIVQQRLLHHIGMYICLSLALRLEIIHFYHEKQIFLRPAWVLPPLTIFSEIMVMVV